MYVHFETLSLIQLFLPSQPVSLTLLILLSPNVTELNIQKILNIQKNFWIFKFKYPNILKDIQVSWGISQCHRVEYPENSEYPEKFLDIQI